MTGRCVYGVDVNPMAAELAKVSLWLEALEPGKPLSFLDQNIRVGNSLLGVTLALLTAGLPDAAFAPIEGDDKATATALRKQNATELTGQYDLFSPSGIPVTNAELARRSAEIAQVVPASLEDLHIYQQRQAAELASSAEMHKHKLLRRRLVRRVRPAQDPRHPPDRDHLVHPGATRRDRPDPRPGRHRRAGRAAGPPVPVLPLARRVPAHLPRRQRGDQPRSRHRLASGFSCVIGNPPWEHIELKEEEFSAARKNMIAALAKSNNPADWALHGEYLVEPRKASGWRHLLSSSGRFPKTARGRRNTYAVFAETARMITGTSRLNANAG